MNNKPARIALLLLLLMVSFALRFYGLGTAEFWGDEILSANAQGLPVSELIREARAPESSRVPVEPPGYHLLNQWTKLVVKNHSNALYSENWRALFRLLSMVLGVLSVALLFVFGRMFFDFKTSFCAATLMAFGFYGIYYSRENRPYSAVVFFTLVATWLYAQTFLKKRYRLFPLYSLALAALGYLHYLGAMVAVIHLAAIGTAFVLHLNVSKRDEELSFIDKKGAIIFALSGLGALVVYSPWLLKTLTIAVRPGVVHEGFKQGASGLFHFPVGPIASTLAHWGGGGFMALILFGLFAFFGLVAVFQKNKAVGALFACFYIVPLAFMTLSPFGKYLHPRYLIFVYPIHMLLTGAGLGLVAKKISRRFFTGNEPRMTAAFLALGCAILFIPGGNALISYYAQGIKCSDSAGEQQRFCRQHLEIMWDKNGRSYLKLPKSETEPMQTITDSQVVSFLEEGKSAYGHGRYNVAVKKFIAVSEAAPRNFEARMYLAKSYWRAGFINGARREWEPLFARCPTFGLKLEALNDLADAAAQNVFFEQQFFNTYTQMSGAQITDPERLSLLLTRQRFAEMKEDWKGALEFNLGAQRYCTPMEMPGIHLGEARIRLRLGEPEKAESLLWANLNTVSPDEPVRSDSAFMLAEKFVAEEEPDKARTALIEGMKGAFEPSALAMTALAVSKALVKNHHPDEALVMIESVIKKLPAPHQPILLIEQGKIFMVTNQAEQGRMSFVKARAIEQNPETRQWLDETIGAIDQGEYVAPPEL